MPLTDEKANNGFLIFLAVFLALIVLGIFLRLISPSFGFYSVFGVDPKAKVDQEEQQIIQPLVTKKLEELKENLKIAENEKTAFLSQPMEPVTKEEAENKVKKLNELRYKIASTSQNLEKARKLAKYYGFKTE